MCLSLANFFIFLETGKVFDKKVVFSLFFSSLFRYLCAIKLVFLKN